KRLIYTDIQKDGTLTEPNFDAVQMLVSHLGVAIIAAGGISTIEHLNKLKRLGADGAIIGRALYTGDINLSQAIANNGG
ncbi:MAG: HisA/HisF-related TIM barrel protein, partial [Chloroflexota bacterium]|nr:HisA/HisF-related TIM barrel protein [Chloroflexota bacterium]